MDWAIPIIVAGSVLLGFLILYYCDKLARREVEIDALNQNISNMKARQKNEEAVNNLDDAGRAKLRNKWAKK